MFLWLPASPAVVLPRAERPQVFEHSFNRTLCPSTRFLATKQMSNAPLKCLTTNKKNLQASPVFPSRLAALLSSHTTLPIFLFLHITFVRRVYIALVVLLRLHPPLVLSRDRVTPTPILLSFSHSALRC